MTKIFFTADMHFGHANVIKYCKRPYSSVEEMDQALIANWNSTVSPVDTVFVLGDVFFCNKTRALEILPQLNGVKCLVHGNHDRVIRKNAPIQTHFKHIYPDLHSQIIDGTFVVMCHYPLLTWDRRSHGSFMLHGHCHNTIPFDPTQKRLDVGVDAQGMRPVSWDEIKNKLG